MTEAIRATLSRLSLKLQSAGIDNPRLDVRLLIAAATERDPQDIWLHDSQILSSQEISQVEAYVERRRCGEPVSRITGEREFWGLPYRLSAGTLDPRPDSETLVSASLSMMSQKANPPESILDVGTGTGCLLFSLMTEWPEVRGVGIDIELDAVLTARQNASVLKTANQPAFLVGNWLSSLSDRYDVIISNPPYVSSSEIDNLQREVIFFDPRRALDGGPDGLTAYRQLIPECRDHLAIGGLLVLEVGAGQDRDVKKLLSAAGLEKIEVHPDLSGHIRCITSWAP